MTHLESTLAAGDDADAGKGHRRRWPVVLVAILAVVLALVIASSFITLPYYSLVPGDALPVSSLIKVPPGRAYRPHGHVLLTDVGVAPVLLVDLLPDLLSSDTALVSSSALIGSAPASEFNAQGTVDMQESQLTAEVAAFRQLGYSVPERNAGAVVYQILPGTAAWRSLHVGEVVTSLGGRAITSAPGLVKAMEGERPGSVVALTVGSVRDPSASRTVTVKLGSSPRDRSQAFLGIYAVTQPQYQLPFHVSISSDGIGGPSAGLAFTLGILDTLAGGDLTGGRTVAATGTIHPDGTVGPVGGVAEKTVAVERAGATVFLVPKAEYAVAEAKATPQLKVFAVTSLPQALHDLAVTGGHLGRAATGPVSGPGGHSAPAGWQDDPWS
ncbi:MAG: S16 family serine protease [Acidimicrobiales bacterium]